MNSLENFEFEGRTIHVELSAGRDPWFLAEDVCAALGISTSNLARTIPADERGSYSVRTPGGMQAKLHLSEPGLYRLIFSSRKEAAERFKSWVVKDVLPTIRRTGTYDITAEASQTQALAEAREMAREVLQLRQINAALDSQAVAALGAEHYSGGQALYDLRETLAMELGIGVRDVMEYLVQLGVLLRYPGHGFMVGAGWKDLVFARTEQISSTNKSYVYEFGTPRLKPGRQREFIARLYRVIHNDLPVLPRDEKTKKDLNCAYAAAIASRAR